LWAHKAANLLLQVSLVSFFAQEYIFICSTFKCTFLLAQPFIVGHFTGGGKDEIYLPEGTANMFQTNGDGPTITESLPRQFVELLTIKDEWILHISARNGNLHLVISACLII